jgi:copper chaperone CopZ
MPHGDLRQTVLLISGMRGNVCRERIAAALQAVRGVRSVDVSLYRARATIVHDRTCDRSALFRATLNTGYNASVPPGAEGVSGGYPSDFGVPFHGPAERGGGA